MSIPQTCSEKGDKRVNGFFLIHDVYDLYRELVKFIPLPTPVPILGLRKIGFGEIFVHTSLNFAALSHGFCDNHRIRLFFGDLF